MKNCTTEKAKREVGRELVKAEIEAAKRRSDFEQSSPTITGVGHATSADGQTTVYFATAEWPQAQAFRKALGLEKNEGLHVTLASTEKDDAGRPKDVHGAPKKADLVEFGVEGAEPVAAPSGEEPSGAFGALGANRDADVKGLVGEIRATKPAEETVPPTATAPPDFSQMDPEALVRSLEFGVPGARDAVKERVLLPGSRAMVDRLAQNAEHPGNVEVLGEVAKESENLAARRAAISALSGSSLERARQLAMEALDARWDIELVGPLNPLFGRPDPAARALLLKVWDGGERDPRFRDDIARYVATGDVEAAQEFVRRADAAEKKGDTQLFGALANALPVLRGDAELARYEPRILRALMGQLQSEGEEWRKPLIIRRIGRCDGVESQRATAGLLLDHASDTNPQHQNGRQEALRALGTFFAGSELPWETQSRIDGSLVAASRPGNPESVRRIAIEALVSRAGKLHELADGEAEYGSHGTPPAAERFENVLGVLRAVASEGEADGSVRKFAREQLRTTGLDAEVERLPASAPAGAGGAGYGFPPMPGGLPGIKKGAFNAPADKGSGADPTGRSGVGRPGIWMGDLAFSDHLERHLPSSPAAGTKLHVKNVADISAAIEGEIDPKTGALIPISLPADINDPKWVKRPDGSVVAYVQVRFREPIAQAGVLEVKDIPEGERQNIYIGERVLRGGSYYVPMYKGRPVLLREATLVVGIHDGSARPETVDGKEVWKSYGQVVEGTPVEGMPGLRLPRPEVITVLAGPVDAQHPSDFWLESVILPKLKGAIPEKLAGQLQGTVHHMMDVSEAGRIAAVWGEALNARLQQGQPKADSPEGQAVQGAVKEKSVAIGLSAAVGNAKPGGDPVAAYNAVQGVFFELSRREGLSRVLKHEVGTWEGEAATFKVEYSHVRRDTDGKLVAEPVKARIENDVPVGAGHIVETKHYSRRTCGEGSAALRRFLSGEGDGRDVPDSLLGLYNQAVKYQAAMSARPDLYRAATIELDGNLDPEFVSLLAERVPDVELLVRLPLSEGKEVVLRLKEAKGRDSLARRPAFRDLTEEERAIYDGVLKAQRAGKILEPFGANRLEAKDVRAALERGEITQAAHDEILGAELDPYKLKSVETFKAFEMLNLRKRHQYFIKASEAKSARRENPYETSLDDEAAGELLKRAVRQVEESHDLVRVQYDFGYRKQYLERKLNEATTEKQKKNWQAQIDALPAQAERTEAEFRARVQKIADEESTRQNTERANPSIHQRRASMGHRGPVEGTPLDPLHIYMDAVKAVQGEDKAAKRGREAQEATRTSRSYDNWESFPTGKEIADRIGAGEFRERKDYVEVSYPEVKFTVEDAADVEKPNMRVIEDAPGQAVDAKLREDNVKRLAALKSAALASDPRVESGTQRAIKFNLRGIESAERRYQEARAAMVAEIEGVIAQKVDGEGKRKLLRDIHERHDAGVEDARRGILDAYQKALDPPGVERSRYRRYIANVDRRFSENRVKFVYHIGPDPKRPGEDVMRLVQEALRPGAERPSHSELGGGRNTYGAGEFYVQDGKITVINNGSGHYRPSAEESLHYVEAILRRDGFEMADDLRLPHARLPFTAFDDADRMLVVPVVRAPPTAPAAKPGMR